MYWEKAKTLTIVFLAILNLLLAVLVYLNSNRYAMTKAQENAIYKVLSANKVVLYDQLIKEYKPMKPINVLPINYNMDTIIKMVFGGNEGVDSFIEFNRTIYYKEKETLIIEDGIVTYENEKASKLLEPVKDGQEEIAKNICNEFIEKNKLDLPALVLDSIVMEQKYIVLNYSEIYKNNIIYSNFIRFFVSKDEIFKVEFSFSEVLGFERNLKEICPVDEVLYALTQHLRSKNDYNEIFINKIDKVYYQDEKSSDKETNLKATPCYRVFVEQIPEPFLLDAYTCEVKDA